MSEECTHNCGSCGVSGCGDREEPPLTSDNRVKHVFCVHSGKGGVGKSLVTGLLASELVRKGYKVAIFDADATGPSAPKMFGVSSTGISCDLDGNINPPAADNGIKMLSVNLLIPPDQQDTPVLWRGPVINGLLRQFWENANWGDVDIMLIDMPPGTSDVSFTMMQDLKYGQMPMPLRGVISVSTPQELVGMIVGKAVNMAAAFEQPVIGLVENMAYFVCDECGKKHFIYGEPQGAEVAARYEIPATATLPIDPAAARLCDAGKVAEYPVDGALDDIIAAIEAAMVEPEPEAEEEEAAEEA